MFLEVEAAALSRLAVLNSKALEKRVSGLAEPIRKRFLAGLTNAVVAESARGDATRPHVKMMKALVAKFSFEFHLVSGDADTRVPAPLLAWLLMLAIDVDDREVAGKVIARSGQKLEQSVFIDLYNHECTGESPAGDPDSFADKASLLLAGNDRGNAMAI